MTLINTDGMSFIGPGSEWFWTAVSGVVLAVTFLAIYRQLALQRSAAAIEQHSRLLRDWHAEPMLRNRIAVLTAISDGAEPGQLPEEVEHIGNFWEGVGYLVHAGHVDRRLVYGSFGQAVPMWWAVLEPSVRVWRTEENGDGIWDEFEWLTKLFARMDKQAHVHRDFSDAAIRKALPAVLETNAKALRSAEAMRTMVAQPAPPVRREHHPKASPDEGVGEAPASVADQPESNVGGRNELGARPRWVSRDAFVGQSVGVQADPALGSELRELAPDVTDEPPER